LCNSTAASRGVFYSEDNFNNTKIPLIKVQLAVAVVMFAFCIDYIIIYATIFYRIKNYQQSRLKTPDATCVLITNESTVNAPSLPPIDVNVSTSIDGSCQTSLNDSLHHSRWSFEFIDLNPIRI
jgi:hypothetical protein